MVVCDHRRRNERHRRNEYLVAGSDADKLQSDMKRRRRGVHRDSLAGANRVRRSGARSAVFGPQADPTRAQDLGDRAFLSLVVQPEDTGIVAGLGHAWKYRND